MAKTNRTRRRRSKFGEGRNEYVFDLVGNPVVISVAVLLILSAIRLNVVFALILASIVGGAAAGLGCSETMKAFLGMSPYH